MERDPVLGARGWALVTITSVTCSAVMFRGAPRLGFLGDDPWVIGAAIEPPLFSEYTLDGARFFRPVASVGLWAQHGLFGVDATGYHHVSVLLHALGATLVVGLVLALFGALERSRALVVQRSTARATALAAGAVFVFHPSHGEAVNWISAQPDLIAACASLAAVAAFLGSVDGPAGWRISSVVLVAAAVLSKESAVAVLVVLIVASATTKARDSDGAALVVQLDRTIRPLAPHLGVVLAYFALRWWVLGTPVGGYGLEVYSVPPGRLVALTGASLGRTVMPAAVPLIWVIVAVLTLLGALIGVVRYRSFRRGESPNGSAMARAAVFAAGATGFSLAPVAALGVSPYGPQGERYAYFASAFASVLIAIGWSELRSRSRPVASAVAAFWLIVVCLVSAREAGRWEDAATAADSVSATLREIEADGPVHLVAVPDSVRGATAFRNSATGLGLFGDHLRDVEFRVLTSQRMRSPDAAVAVSLSADRRRMVVRGEGSECSLATSEPAGGRSDPSRAWTVTAVDDRGCVVEFAEPIDASSVWYFSLGRLRRLG